ncbi:MAG TPA: M48 family metallopeptidase [Gemmatimonadaceae bacterium]|nr:M48 family metallopeptidase [Gemmatimonadaceae bacterium]
MKRLITATAIALSSSLAPLATPCAAQGLSGFNLFSPSQDVEIGKQSATEAERQLSLLNDAATNRYLNGIIQRLAAVAPGAKYPYQIKAVNSADINAFALPGGPMYVNTGLIAAARNEAELAGVLAHEMSHVALRHGTQQASTAYLGQAGLSILGGLFGNNKNASQIVNAVGGLGLNTLFLSYSRDMEYQADASGANIMAKAGYDPHAMANFLELLRAKQGSDPSKLQQFFSDHPATADREARIRQLATNLSYTGTQDVGNFASVRTRVAGLATTSSQPVGRLDVPVSAGGTVNRPVAVRVDPPSTRFVRFAHPAGFITIDYPDNWSAYAAPSGFAVSIAPAQGVAQTSDGQQHLIYGMIVNHYAPFATAPGRSGSGYQRKNYVPFEDNSASNTPLQEATNDLVNTIITSNPYLRMVDGSARSERIAGASAMSLQLAGMSPVTGEEEQVTVFTRGLPDGHVMYALAVVPTRNADQLNPTFTRMMQSLVVNDAAAHRTRGTTASGGLQFSRP